MRCSKIISKSDRILSDLSYSKDKNIYRFANTLLVINKTANFFKKSPQNCQAVKYENLLIKQSLV